MTNDKGERCTSSSPAFADDVEGTETFAYDAIGNLTTHTKPSGATVLEWNAYGKVRQVTTSTARMDFGYDAQQNRLSKTVTTAGVTKTSYYIRDAQGNALAVYERKGSSLIWKEQELYGSSRLGMAKPEREVTGFFWQNASYTLVTGARSYELSNHLGNVLAVISDRGELQSAQDYYPFGMAMPGRTWSVSMEKYKYGFNGKETDHETGLNDFGARLYDSRIGRWLAVDPLEKKYPALTPYNFVANTPLIAMDPNGKEIIILYDPVRDRSGNIVDQLGVKYVDGKVYNLSDGKEYTGNDEYVTKVTNHLAQLSKDDPEFSARIKHLEKSGFQHTIEAIDPNNSAKLTNENIPDNKKNASNGIGTGSMTIYDPDKTTNEAGSVRKPRAALAHELLSHGYEADKGIAPTPATKTANGIPMAEVNGVNIENKARAAEPRDPKRKTYQGKPIPEELLDDTHK